jgi:gluconokinase
VGRALAAAAGFAFHDADDLHAPGNVEKMRRGVALTDEDRAPWLHDVRRLMLDVEADHTNAVLACSALRESYREYLAASGADLRWVYLRATPEILRQRLASRRGHFASPAILADQLARLEEPEAAVTLDAARPVPEIVASICAVLELRCAGG